MKKLIAFLIAFFFFAVVVSGLTQNVYRIVEFTTGDLNVCGTTKLAIYTGI